MLCQNVDSYKGKNETWGWEMNFAGLLEHVADVSPLMRVRFSTSHPKDMTDEVLEVMSRHAHICKYIHLPVQSGNSEVLERMTRTYDRDWYMGRIEAIRRIVDRQSPRLHSSPSCASRMPSSACKTKISNYTTSH